jgi:hypothetical protein
MLSSPPSPLNTANNAFSPQVKKPLNYPVYPYSQAPQLPHHSVQPQAALSNFIKLPTSGTLLSQPLAPQTQQSPITLAPTTSMPGISWLLPALGIGGTALAVGIIYKAYSSNKKSAVPPTEASKSASAKSTALNKDHSIKTDTFSTQSGDHTRQNSHQPDSLKVSTSHIHPEAFKHTRTLGKLTGFGISGIGVYKSWNWWQKLQTVSTTTPTTIPKIPTPITPAHITSSPEILPTKPAVEKVISFANKVLKSSDNNTVVDSVTSFADKVLKPNDNITTPLFKKFASILQSPKFQPFASRYSLLGAAGIGLAGVTVYLYRIRMANPITSSDEASKAKKKGKGKAASIEYIDLKDWQASKMQESKELVRQNFSSEKNKLEDEQSVIEELVEKMKHAPSLEKELIQEQINYHKRQIVYLNKRLETQVLGNMIDEATQASVDYPHQQVEFDFIAKNYEKDMNRASRIAAETEAQIDILREKLDLKTATIAYRADIQKYPRQIRAERNKVINILKELKVDLPTTNYSLIHFIEVNHSQIHDKYKTWFEEYHPDKNRDSLGNTTRELTGDQKELLNDYDRLIEPFMATIKRKTGLEGRMRDAGFTKEQIEKELKV